MPTTGISSSTSPSLIQRAQRYDGVAWQRLSQLYVPLVYRWVRQAGLEPNVAGDIVQDVFQTIYTKIGQFQHRDQQSSFRGWLWTVTRNQVRLHFRQAAARPEVTGGSELQHQLAEVPDQADVEADRPENADVHLLHRALRLIRDDFEEHTWQAFWRMTVDEQPAAEIAADLGMNAHAVRQSKYRVLCRLRQELADQ